MSDLRQKLTERTAGDITLTVAEALASVVPLIGGPLGVAVGEIRAERDTRVVDFVIDLYNSHLAMGKELDHDYVKSASFKLRLESTVEQIANARQAAKRTFYLNALAKSSTSDRPSDDEWQLLADTLDRVQPVHLELLALVMSSGATRLKPGPAIALIRGLRPDMPPTTLVHAWEDLVGVGVLQSHNLVTESGPDALADLEESGDVISPFGLRFVAFLGMQAG